MATPQARLSMPLVLLALAHATSPAAWSDNLWLESSSSAPFPELEASAVPLSRSAWRMLSERRVQVRLDGRPALLLSIKPRPDPPRILLLLERSDLALQEAAPLGELWKGFFDSLPEATRVAPFVLAREVQQPRDEDMRARELAAWLRGIPHQGEAAPLGRGLDLALAAARARPGTRQLLMVFSMTQDPELAEAAPRRRDLLRELDQLELPVIALSLGSDADRPLMRQLGEARGGMSIHSWSTRNLQTALARFATGLQLTQLLRVQSPLHGQDGSLRTLEVRVAGGDQILASGRIRMPGTPTPLPEPTTAPHLAPPVAPPPWPAAAPEALPAATPLPLPLPVLALGSWPVPGADPEQAELASLASAQLAVLESHARAVLDPALAGVRLAVENRDPAMARRLYARARVNLAFVGSTFGHAATSIEGLLDHYQQAPGADPAFLASQRDRLRELRSAWSRFKLELKDWEANLARIPPP